MVETWHGCRKYAGWLETWCGDGVMYSAVVVGAKGGTMYAKRERRL